MSSGATTRVTGAFGLPRPGEIEAAARDVAAAENNLSGALYTARETAARARRDRACRALARVINRKDQNHAE